ncbi:MAG: DUF3127 domain-containing protein [Chlorobi bacterium]|nr:DUF3127 domain-containing protein [Chlorobiota bacterium]
MELKGTIKHIFETQTLGASGFKKREMILLTDERYPQPVKIEFIQEKTALLDNFKPGDEVTVAFDIRGREWINPEGKTIYFTSLQGWRITPVQPAPQDDVPPPYPEDDTPDLPFDDEGEDDLPF